MTLVGGRVCSACECCSYEEIRKLVENNEVDEAVKQVKGRKKNNSKDNSYSFELLD